MVLATNLGFPRIGAKRELKSAVESYWKGQSTVRDLQDTGKDLRARHWKLQKSAGLDHIPSNDFSFYDHVLDMTCALGLVPSRYGFAGGAVDLDTYFAMARGNENATAMEMTKWYDTNYHYIVPEFEKGMIPKLCSTKIFDEFAEAKALGIDTRPVLIGPASYVFLGKAQHEHFDAVETVKSLIPVYNEILKILADMGAGWVQIDEPLFALDLDANAQDVIKEAYEHLQKPEDLNILVATYFEALRDNAVLAFSLPVQAIHIDLCRNAGQANTAANTLDDALDQALEKVGDRILSLGLVDGRNIWRNDLNASLGAIQKAVAKLGADKVWIAPSCSLLHTPVDLEGETGLDKQIKSWLAFAKQKVEEIVTLSKGAQEGRDAIGKELSENEKIQDDRKTSPRIHSPAVKARTASITDAMKKRKSPYAERRGIQKSVTPLPLYPTTTIGSFPQTGNIRTARAAYKKGELGEVAYMDAMMKEIKAVVDFQHEIDLDILVHGEPERNDMVEYFGEQLKGFAFTKNGWVQSYGSRCVKPPIIFGDVSRPESMTVKWAQYAQSLTRRTMKGMLTGPVTILQWSFVRDDQPRADTAQQIALAVRDEVSDLEKAGIRIIQIDEAAFREGLPLRRADWDAYLKSAVENFRLTSCCVEDKTQIHTHMCYSEFNDIIRSIADMDADVISIETSRSQMELLDAFAAFKYPNEIGPGVYDIHSPRVPTVEEMVDLLEKAQKVLSEEQIWVNPDCGLKTRGWAEVKPALTNMVAAAKEMRERAKKAAA
ncbi:MAG: 5-methyltetrahydropteroyltriglutamate--homocysteine S-methyltransferase [Alphaproteobacteria bacterium]|nr:5-methyltetrahydropteroyltriglutamate--homocysteine S-methyltransferase [Alphaproteobacteria bacterium]